MKLQAVIFDMDGTLIDSLEDMRDSVNAVLAQAGYPVKSLDEIRGFVGNGARKLIERSLPAQAGDAEVERMLGLYKVEYQRRLLVKTHPYDGIPELLKTLKEQGIKLAVLSNKPHEAAIAICEKLFPGVFDLCWGDRPGIPRKPDPTAVWNALGRLGIGRESAVYVGDSETDIRTAQNAGLYAVGVSWGFRGRQALEAEHPDMLCESVEALERALIQKMK